jgi:hypothetical protein
MECSLPAYRYQNGKRGFCTEAQGIEAVYPGTGLPGHGYKSGKPGPAAGRMRPKYEAQKLLNAYPGFNLPGFWGEIYY